MKRISLGILAALLGALTLVVAQTATQGTRPGPTDTPRPVPAPSPAQPANAKPTLAQTSSDKPILKGFPFTNESLSYVANWPSGLSLGEAHLSATASSTAWRFELGLDAGIPGFTVKDTFQSTSTLDLCSETLSKDSVHGTRKSKETEKFDAATSELIRTPSSSAAEIKRTPSDPAGETRTRIPACTKDALTFLYYARRELGQGRVPTPQQIVFGAIYDGNFQYAGAETVTVGNKRVLTDKLICHIKGPASDIQFDVFFDRDPARTPVLIRVPLPLGKFSLELVR